MQTHQRRPSLEREKDRERENRYYGIVIWFYFNFRQNTVRGKEHRDKGENGMSNFNLSVRATTTSSDRCAWQAVENRHEHYFCRRSEALEKPEALTDPVLKHFNASQE